MTDSISPTTGEVIASYDDHDEAEVDRRVAAASSAFGPWAAATLDERAAVLSAVADLLDAEVDDHARLMVDEMGKPVTAARAEAQKCAWVCRHYATHGAGYLAPDEVATDASRSYVRFDPLGPVLAVMPWNFPYWQVFRFAAPALMAGDVGLLKHASNVFGCALAIEDLFRRAGAPEGVFQSLLIGSSEVEGVLRDERVAAATVTGSERAGRSVAAVAGELIKPVVLELGGSDPFVVLADADLDAAVATAVTARLLNNGQSCIAAKRFVVDQRVANEFVERFAKEVESQVVGDPRDEATQVGPLARDDLRSDLHEQVQQSVKDGAHVVLGGKPLDGPGFFYAPTVLDGVTPAMAAGAEETFGPVAAVMRVNGDDEAIATANATRYGLGASLWTRDLERAERLVPRIQAGCVFVNDMVKSDPRVPFGGIKKSGFGRELGREGIRSFVNTKTVWLA